MSVRLLADPHAPAETPRDPGPDGGPADVHAAPGAAGTRPGRDTQAGTPPATRRRAEPSAAERLLAELAGVRTDRE